eukprot:5725185-Amphidinium_carterae.1
MPHLPSSDLCCYFSEAGYGSDAQRNAFKKVLSKINAVESLSDQTNVELNALEAKQQQTTLRLSRAKQLLSVLRHKLRPMQCTLSLGGLSQRPIDLRT